jgi:hypothetical protein
MAEEAKGLYYGPGNTGYATVLGSDAPSLFDVMDSLKVDREADEQLKRDEETAKTAELNDWLEYSPEKIWEPYGNYQQKMYNDYVDEAARIYGAGGVVSGEDKAYLAKMQGEIKNVNNRMNSLNDARTKALEILKDKDSTIDNEKFSRHIGRYHLNIKDGLIPPEEMSSEGLMGVLNDYNYYDQQKVTAKILKYAGEQNDAEIDTSPFGYRIEKQRKYQTGFNYAYDTNGEVKRDENNQKIFEITPQLVDLYMGDDEGAMMVQKIKDQHEVMGETITNEEAIKELVSPQAYFEEKKQAETDTGELQKERERNKKGSGTTEENEANIFFQNLDTLFISPQEDESQPLEYYIDNEGNISKNTGGDVLKPVSTQLVGKVIGKAERRGAQPTTITKVLHNYKTGKTYYKTSNSEDLKELNTSNAPDLIETITSHNSRYKGFVGYGRKLGYLGADAGGLSQYNVQATESESAKNNKQQQEQQSQKIKSGIEQFKSAINTSLESRKGAGRSLFLGMNQDAIAQINTTLKSIPTGVELVLNEETYENPVIEVKGTLLESSYTFWIDGNDTEIMADEEGFKKLIKGMRPTRAIDVKLQSTPKSNTSTNNTSTETGGAY